MTKYKIEFDKELCIGALACNAISEKHWPRTDDGKVDLTGATFNEETKKYELIINQDEYELMQESADVCPVLAIIVTPIEDTE